MANPLHNEQEIYDRIRKESITIDPIIWELIDHHINNDLYMINMIIGATVMDGESLNKEDADKVLNHSKQIQDFLAKLSKATRPKG